VGPTGDSSREVSEEFPRLRPEHFFVSSPIDYLAHEARDVSPSHARPACLDFCPVEGRQAPAHIKWVPDYCRQRIRWDTCHNNKESRSPPPCIIIDDSRRPKRNGRERNLGTFVENDVSGCGSAGKRGSDACSCGTHPIIADDLAVGPRASVRQAPLGVSPGRRDSREKRLSPVSSRQERGTSYGLRISCVVCVCVYARCTPCHHNLIQHTTLGAADGGNNIISGEHGRTSVRRIE
jgi:hypothetical protein